LFILVCVSLALSGQALANAVLPSADSLLNTEITVEKTTPDSQVITAPVSTIPTVISIPSHALAEPVTAASTAVGRLSIGEANEPIHPIASPKQVTIEKSNQALASAYKSKMAWPLLPGESLEDLAQQFYPQNQALQARFLTMAVRLPANQSLRISATDVFNTPVLIALPTDAALGLASLPIKQVPAKSNFVPLQFSYQLSGITTPAPMGFWEKSNQRIHRQYNQVKTQLQTSTAGIEASMLALSKRYQAWRKALADSATPTSSVVMAKPEGVKNLLKIDVAQDFLANIQLDPIKLLVIAGLLMTALWLMRQHKKVLSQLDVTNLYQPSFSTNSDELIQLKDDKEANSLNIHNPLAKAQQLVAENRMSEAAQTLKASIAEAPKSTLMQRLFLLRLLRELSWEDEFAKYANELHQFYNVVTPSLSNESVDLETPSTLEAFTHITAQLQQLWPEEAAEAYLQDLLTDNRGGERMGFSEEVLSEMALLLELSSLRARLN
jgi:hypothetical protein